MLTPHMWDDFYAEPSVGDPHACTLEARAVGDAAFVRVGGAIGTTVRSKRA